MRKSIFLLFVCIYYKSTAQTFVGKLGIATNTISSITYANSDFTMSKYGYEFGDYYNTKNTKIYVNSKSTSIRFEDALLIYFTESLEKPQAIVVNLSVEEFNESLALMKYYKFHNEDFEFDGVNGLKWSKTDSPYRFFTDAKNKSIKVFYFL